MIVDVLDPRNPAIASNVAIGGYGLDVSHDRLFARLLNTAHGEVRFKIDQLDKPQETLETSSDFEAIDQWRHPTRWRARAVRCVTASVRVC